MEETSNLPLECFRKRFRDFHGKCVILFIPTAKVNDVCIAQKTLFFAFFANFVATKRLEKREKTPFSHTFYRTSCKKLKKNAVFCIFCELCTKRLEKSEKTLFSHTFCGTSCKKLKERYYISHGFLYYTRNDFMPLVDSKKGKNLFSILVSSLQLTELNAFIVVFY